MVELTDEQRAIVAHGEGPALVFAVAGAGKTTAMVHRIERLVRERAFPARQILATSFSRAAVDDIRRALDGWPHCGPVRAMTLHALGYRIVRRAARDGFLQLADDGKGAEDLADVLFYRTLARARREQVAYAGELETVDKEDFLNYVGACKGNLRYADLAAARLPAGTRAARQAEAPPALDWYLPLYRLFETVRREESVLTFDDMLMTGWEVLVRHSEALREWQSGFRAVLVDEFQDVNLAQSELLDLLTEPHRSYMAIGDDDQTIYEWRGADPGFILGFERRYGAVKYVMSDNFRSGAAPVALANAVIAHNKRRQPKRLSLTRGFAGDAQVHIDDGAADMAAHVVREIRQAASEGFALRDVAILVRVYAQTPYIEQFLIQAGMPYRVVGSTPFYERQEIATLLHYLRLGELERELQAGLPLGDGRVAELGKAWNAVYNRPTRYMPRELADKVLQDAAYKGAPLARALELRSGEASGATGRRMTELAQVLRWLAGQALEWPADHALSRLVGRLEYRNHLLHTSGFAEVGAGKVANVDAFIAYASGKGAGPALLAHVAEIAAARVGRDGAEGDAVSIMTIFRAKGLEWPIVFVPNCEAGVIPFGDDPARLEEERRLLYVALTRAKRNLHLHVSKQAGISPFLVEAGYDGVLDKVRWLRHLLGRSQAERSEEEAARFDRLVQELHLERFFIHWWKGVKTE